MKNIKYFIYFFFLLFDIYAHASGGGDLIEASGNVNEILVIAVQLLVLSMFILGFGFVVISFAKFKKHRKMPTFVPLQTVVLMFVGGVIMIILGVVYIYTGEHVFGPDYLSILEPGDGTL